DPRPIGFEWIEGGPDATSDGTRFTTLRRSSHVGPVRIQLAVEVAAGGPWTTTISFDPDAFRRADVERIARRYATLLRSAAGAADEPVDTLALMDGAECDEV